MIANIATLNIIHLASNKGEIERKFTPESLQQLCQSATNKKVTLGFNGIVIGKILSAWVDNDRAFADFDVDMKFTYLPKYLVPGLKITTTKNNEFKTVRCIEFALTDKPIDKTLFTIEQLNDSNTYTGQGD